ncbi:MAG: hypothetical protein WAW36_08040 [Methylovulum miyakonense]|uniref:hypothetical protein n=1 Tax=Methylovulum miyakonense TaxID=645578 RepID=UPI003BB77A07
MSFVREPVSDAEKYGFEALSKMFRTPMFHLKHCWTIDREQNIFLSWLRSGREEYFAEQDFLLWWDGVPIKVYITGSSTEDSPGKIVTTWESPGLDIPENFQHTREEVICVLKDALKVFKSAGYYGQQEDRTVVFKF